MAQSNSLCTYVSLADYDWTGYAILGGPKYGTEPPCHGLAIEWNLTVVCFLAGMFAVTLWIILEVIIQAMVTFRKRSTMYFWTIIFTACSDVLYTICVTLMCFSDKGQKAVGNVLYPMAWCLTNTGAIAVLYSRLHLIINNPRAIKWLGWLLLALGVPLQVFLVVASDAARRKTFFLGLRVYKATPGLESIVNFVEIALVSTYIYFFSVTYVKDGGSGFQSIGKGNQIRWTFTILILGELFVVAGDVAIIAVWLDHYYLARLAIAPFVYATKLKVEFLILNCLTRMTQQQVELRHISSSARGNSDGPSFITSAV